jgi:hypothetical protein
MNNVLREAKPQTWGGGIPKEKIIRFEANKNKIDLQGFKEINQSQKGNQRRKMRTV